MTQEAKRISMADEVDSVSGQSSARFGPSAVVRRAVNYHNIWWGISIEPETQDANSNGVWVLWIKKDSTAADPVFSSGNIQNETFNQRIIACGNWAASNQTPFNMSNHMNSSRNLLAGEELVCTIRVFGLSAGNQRTLITLCAGETGA